VRVFALGPPRVATLLADMDPKGSEAFPGHGLRARSSFFAAAEAAEGADDSADPVAVAAAVQPFARRFSLTFDQAFIHKDHGSFFRSYYGSDNHPPVQAGDVQGESPDWRRIDKDWLYSAEDFALYLNKGINNTSLVLAFELTTSGRVLLFAADAQRGNWKSWNSASFEDEKKPKDDPGRTITAKDLLARTVLYKVGHHGSHNATLKGTLDDDYPNLSWMGQDKRANEFTAMITAVKEWAIHVKPKPWIHPLPSIRTALDEKCRGRVFQTDTSEQKPFKDVVDDDWNAFLQRRVAVTDLYFDYEVKDE
jgi:hypothetical protein